MPGRRKRILYEASIYANEDREHSREEEIFDLVMRRRRRDWCSLFYIIQQIRLTILRGVEGVARGERKVEIALTLGKQTTVMVSAWEKQRAPNG